MLHNLKIKSIRINWFINCLDSSELVVKPVANEKRNNKKAGKQFVSFWENWSLSRLLFKFGQQISIVEQQRGKYVPEEANHCENVSTVSQNSDNQNRH